MNSPYRNLQFTAAQLERAINALIKHRDCVTRPTLVRWRKHWNFAPPYEHSHAEMLAHYGDMISLGFKPDLAKQYTIEHFENLENTNEHGITASEAATKAQATAGPTAGTQAA
jgi:hypothetical protein